MSQLPVDLDSESIQFDGKWYTRDELARRIKSMLDAGEFSISRPSAAIEQLTATLASLRTVAFRATPEMADALTQHAQRLGKSPGQLVREALAEKLQLAVAPTGEVVAPWTTPAPPLPGVPLPSAPAVQTPPLAPGPGALKQGQSAQGQSAQGQSAASPTVVVDRSAIITENASPEEVAAAVDLTSRKKDDEEAVERRWFGG